MAPLCGGNASLFPREVYGVAAPYSLSVTNSPSLHMLLYPQQGLKCRMGKKEGVKEKNPHKTKTLTNQTKGKRIFRLWGAGFHRVGGASDILQGLLIAFPLGGACSSQARWPCRIRVYSGNQSLTVAPPCLSPASPTLDSPCQTADCAAFPSLGPKVSNCECKTCALAPLKVKEKKIVALSPTGLLLP